MFTALYGLIHNIKQITFLFNSLISSDSDAVSKC